MLKLIQDEILEQSGVVANCRMNRERSLSGSNGYSIELGVEPLELLKAKVAKKELAEGKSADSARVRWLDLCCGSGRALIEATQLIQAAGLERSIEIVGVDLVGMFAQTPPDVNGLPHVPHLRLKVLNAVSGRSSSLRISRCMTDS